MKLSIRLQNHGRKNHPFWWIVVAPNRKNIFGRYIQHVGYWSPRHGVYLQRQIVLNIPRIKHWMACGAVPTFKVQKFLSLWNILPAPWYYKKSQEELAKDQPQGEQLTDKKKRKIEWKEKRRAREILDPKNYYKEEARFKFMTSWKKKIDDLKRTQERENQILRDLLLYNEFSKLAKINELSGKTTFTDTQQLQRLKQSLAKAKAELNLIKKNHPTTSAFEQTKSIKIINDLCIQIRKAELEKASSIADNLKQLQNQSEYLTEDLLKAKLEYELVTKKIEKNFEELETFSNLNQPVLLQQYADFLVGKKEIEPEQAYIEAQREFVERGVSGYPMTKFELEYWDEIKKRQADAEADVLHPELRDADVPTILKKAIDLGDFILPVKRTVHPIPDLTSYIPEDYYEPLANHDFKVKVDDPLSPYEELQKYHQKKVKKSDLVV